MASACLESFLDGDGTELGVGALEDEDMDERGSQASKDSKNKAPKAGAKNKRKKADEVAMLSTSFSCWRKVPDARLNFSKS